MKLLIMSVLVSFCSLAYAGQSTGLPQGTIGLESIAGSVVEIQPFCPKHARCVTNGTIVTLQFTGGCLDNLLPLTYLTSSDKQEVFVHALLAQNEQSRVAFCRPPSYRAKLTLVNQYPPLTIHFMGTGLSVQVH